MPNAFGMLVQELWKRWKELPPGSEDAALSHIPTSSWTCAVEERDCSTPLCSSQSAAGIRGTEDIPPMRVPAPDPKLTNTSRATEVGSWSTQKSHSATREAECHRRGWSTHRANLASRPDLYRFPAPSFQEEGSQSSVYSQRTGEKNEREEVSSLSPTPPSPGRALHLWKRGTLSQPRARAVNSSEGSKPP